VFSRRITKDDACASRSIKIYARTSEMKKGRRYNIYTKKDGWKIVSHGEWAAWVKARKRASIVQVLGVFGRVEDRNFLQVCTGLSKRKKRTAGEWESRIWDAEAIDLVNPSYCPGSIEQIEAMHARALSNARQFLRNYIERPVPYWENILDGADPRYLAKTPDFAVDYFEEDYFEEDD
jgi:hypothetical protein